MPAPGLIVIDGLRFSFSSVGVDSRIMYRSWSTSYSLRGVDLSGISCYKFAIDHLRASDKNKLTNSF